MERFGRRAALALGLLGSALAATGLGSSAGADDSTFGGSVAVVLDSGAEGRPGAAALDEAADLVSLRGRQIGDLDTDAAASLAGYLLVLGQRDDGAWLLDPRPAGPAEAIVRERAALAVYDLGWSLERLADGTLRISPPADVAPDRFDGHEEWVAWFEVEPSTAGLAPVVAAMAEVSGSPFGRLAVVPDDRLSTALTLAESQDLAVTVEPASTASDVTGSTEIWVPGRLDRAVAADWSVGCVDSLPLVGGRGCQPGADDTPAGARIEDWVVGITGPLDRSVPDPRPAAEGGVGWVNLEAQRYVADAATTGRAPTLTVRPAAESGVDRLPFDSGMVISTDSFGWGRFEIEAEIPVGDGLWPAIWLLGTDDCEGPGRCAAHETERYHEIDLLETRGDGTIVASAHTVVDRLRTETWEHEVADLDTSTIRIELERRPGLIVWRIDGTDVARLTGPARADLGFHRATPMRLIANIAVGGSFAGDRQLGRGSGWLGDALVPGSFPDLDWTTAELRLLEVSFTPLSEELLAS